MPEMSLETTKPVGSPELISRLSEVCAQRGLDRLASQLMHLSELVALDMETIDGALAAIVPAPDLVGRGAGHILQLGGKHLRPMCVALASRAGAGFDARALNLGVAVELVHNATLLHDDVVDLASTRRGAPTAREEYGNAASIFAGDWMLIEALRRVQRVNIPGLLERLLDTIEEMIRAESLQLENRGRIEDRREVYFQVAEGKTAALFRWALYAGGRAGNLGRRECQALESFGLHLGFAFQVIDDVLDLTGDVAETGKELFADLREGKMTYPLIVAVDREPELEPVLREMVGNNQPPSPEVYRRVLDTLQHTGAIEECRRLAQERAQTAIRCLQPLPPGPAVTALATVAEITVNRDR